MLLIPHKVKPLHRNENHFSRVSSIHVLGPFTSHPSAYRPLFNTQWTGKTLEQITFKISFSTPCARYELGFHQQAFSNHINRNLTNGKNLSIQRSASGYSPSKYRSCFCSTISFRTLILEFFDKADNRLLVFTTDAKDQLIPSLKFPAGIKKKTVFFRKPDDMVINAESVKLLETGDISYTPVDQLTSVVDGMLVPTLDNTSSATKWPTVVAGDISNQGHVCYHPF